MPNKFFRFERMIYPEWRLNLPLLVKPLADRLYSRYFPVHADRHPPQDTSEMARFLLDWHLISDADLSSLNTALQSVAVPIETAQRDAHPRCHDGSPVHMPAQWEPIERVLISWGRMYPTLWQMHAEMVEAISQVARVEILAPNEMWARAIAVYLTARGRTNMACVELLILRTDDIWIRDYGSYMGVSANGERVAVNPIYDVHPEYPQADDNAMTNRWAAHHDISVQMLNLHTEGGNLWSDGQGTFIMSSQIFYSNPYYTRETLLDYLHRVFVFDKLIITPRLTLEITGHVDLLVKLASEDTVLVSRATSFSTEAALRKTKRLFERETNARGKAYRVVELPTPPLYMNWLRYATRRAYTNALTVNGRVLVPVYNIPQDEQALRIYQETLPDHTIIPIDSRVGINGGGAVHCMTKEVPV